MKIPSPIPTRKARLEIIPLIDIMFFLLAAFVLVSLTMVKQLTVKVDLPAVASGQREDTKEPFSVAVDARGNVFVGHEAVDLAELRNRLQSRLAADPEVAVTLSGDANTTHGAMVSVLEFIRSCGIHRVAFAVKIREEAAEVPPK
jgi:biopolymer transport protein ExbD